MVDPFKGKIALITGGSSGIGLAAARALAARGSHVWIMARDQGRLEKAAHLVRCDCQSDEQKCGIIAADVSNLKEVLQAVDYLREKIGVPDLLINSAGVVRPGYIQDLKFEHFRWMMEINYLGTVYPTKAVLPDMIERGSGHIVNISSPVGCVGVFGYSAYGASKFAVCGFSDALRVEVKPLGIKVSLVIPPDTDTPQLAYEHQYKPPELKVITDNMKTFTAESVSNTMLRGISKNRYLILIGADTKFIVHASSLIGSNVYPIVDAIYSISRKLVKGKGY
ncbi:MAG: SDR family NAD(P)-dependent oxidoreductase [Chloroflexi bacterium]|nr:MAG: SDR family NAD(P)-dependent oxidoreductase [Chloroflexota bacterium]